MNPWAQWRIQFGTRIHSFTSRIRGIASSLERLDSSLQEFRLFSFGLTPRVSRLHIVALSACFAAASFWIALLAKGQTNHSRPLTQQAAQAQSQQPSAGSEGSTRQDAQTPQTSQDHQAAPSQPSTDRPVSRFRMLTQKEESTIVKAAWAHRGYDDDVHDCSHTIHQIYGDAGYEYPYASSFDLYRGTASFVRVTHPQPGDLIAWPEHVGIVLSAKKHSFYSLVSTGLEAQNYRGRYWRGRGYPRFYRYIVERPARRDTLYQNR